MTAVRVQAPAKVNPWLAVLGRRPDGFHAVDLGMLTLELGDLVEARATTAGGVQLELAGPALSPDVPADERNLAWRAAAAVLALAPESEHRGVALRLEKHVPSRAGLGGGSSDAAAACLATAGALGFAPRREELLEILAGLGSDCPFFLAAATGFARCTGRGEQVEELPALTDDWHVVLITPDLEVPTGAVYARCAEPAAGPQRALPRFDQSEQELGHAMFNDLEAPALAQVPALAAWRQLLDECAPGSRMSGSGSSFFACFRERAAATRCLAEIEAAARGRGLALRGRWITRPAGHGALRIP